jgi:hypothetical protein
MREIRSRRNLIRLAVKEKSFEMAVADNGRGFAGGEKAQKVFPTQGRSTPGNEIPAKVTFACSGGL